MSLRSMLKESQPYKTNAEIDREYHRTTTLANFHITTTDQVKQVAGRIARQYIAFMNGQAICPPFFMTADYQLVDRQYASNLLITAIIKHLKINKL